MGIWGGLDGLKKKELTKSDDAQGEKVNVLSEWLERGGFLYSKMRCGMIESRVEHSKER